MTEKALVSLADLRKKAKHMSKASTQADGDLITYDEALSALLDRVYCDSEDEYERKVALQIATSRVDSSGINKTELVTQKIKAALSSALLEDAEIKASMVDFLLLFSTRNGPIKFHEHLSRCHFTEKMSVHLNALADSISLSDVQAVIRSVDHNPDISQEEAWIKAVRMVLISFEMYLSMELSRKKVTKHLIEFFASHEKSEILQSPLYLEPVNKVINQIQWYSAQ